MNSVWELFWIHWAANWRKKNKLIVFPSLLRLRDELSHSLPTLMDPVHASLPVQHYEPLQKWHDCMWVRFTLRFESPLAAVRSWAPCRERRWRTESLWVHFISALQLRYILQLSLVSWWMQPPSNQRKLIKMHEIEKKGGQKSAWTAWLAWTTRWQQSAADELGHLRVVNVIWTQSWGAFVGDGRQNKG